MKVRKIRKIRKGEFYKIFWKIKLMTFKKFNMRMSNLRNFGILPIFIQLNGFSISNISKIYIAILNCSH